ncbi:MAG: RNA polymerase sigma factor [Myxococcota bacterium]
MTASLSELANRAQAGEREALEALVRALQDPLYRLALRFLGHPEAARDATQEILILVITQLSSFRGESSINTWAYRVASRHLLRRKKQQREVARRFTFDTLEAELGQPPNAIADTALASAEERLLEEEIFLGCTQAMLRALDPPLRIAFVLGAVLELDASDAARALEISEVAFRKRLSRARLALDEFVAKNCGVANPAAPCRCAYQVNHATRQGRFDPNCLRYASKTARTSLETLRAFGEIAGVRRALELYRAQPEFRAPEDFAARIRSLIDGATSLTLS